MFQMILSQQILKSSLCKYIEKRESENLMTKHHTTYLVYLSINLMFSFGERFMTLIMKRFIAESTT